MIINFIITNLHHFSNIDKKSHFKKDIIIWSDIYDLDDSHFYYLNIYYM